MGFIVGGVDTVGTCIDVDTCVMFVPAEVGGFGAAVVVTDVDEWGSFEDTPYGVGFPYVGRACFDCAATGVVGGCFPAAI